MSDFLTTKERATRLRELRVRLKSGEYDGADLMAAWIACEDLANIEAENERLREALNAFKRDSHYADCPEAHELADAVLKEQP